MKRMLVSGAILAVLVAVAYSIFDMAVAQVCLVVVAGVGGILLARTGQSGSASDTSSSEVLEDAALSRLAGLSSVNAISAAEIARAAQQIRERLDAQVDAVTRVNEASAEIGATLVQAVTTTEYVATSAGQASTESDGAQQKLQQVAHRVRQLNESFAACANRMDDLSKASAKAQTIVNQIKSVAAQSRILALNAGIEASKAGEYGRGFAVVAREMNMLSGSTESSARSTVGIVNELRSRIVETADELRSLSGQVSDATSEMESVGDQFDSVRHGASDVGAQIQQLATGASDNQVTLSSIVAEIQLVSHDLRNSLEDISHLDSHAAQLSDSVAEESASWAESDVDCLQRTMYLHCREAASKIEAAFEDGIQTGEITLVDLLDRNYEQFEVSGMPRYHTRFDKFTDATIVDFQDDLLEKLPTAFFCNAVDSNGYVPTHNSRFDQPPTGDPEIDALYCRSKRFFERKLHDGSPDKPMIMQTFKRDTGEMMHDVAVPIFVRGQHWGGLHLGYEPEDLAT